MNFTLQDLVGSTLAFIIFPSVLVFPGYSIGWAFDLFDFKRRKRFTRYIISIVVSVAVVPIIAYLLSLLVSFDAVKLLLVIFIIMYLLIVVGEYKKTSLDHVPGSAPTQYQKWAIGVMVVWVIVSFLSLVDLQLGDRLYNSVVSYDFATRVDMVDAITRTGVPPVNPGFYPGNPEYITSVYYFWYILCSIVDQIGGEFVNARLALIAGDAWCGLALMALIGLYLRIRNNAAGDKAWKLGMLGISLLSISGLDVVPALLNMTVTRYSLGFAFPLGDIEHWNTQITAWVGSLLWVPHHVAAMISLLAGFLFFQYALQKQHCQKAKILLFTGLAFASAVGLSTWVTITFAVFWAIWISILYIRKKEIKLALLMVMVGVLALVFAAPFLFGIIKGGTGASGLPIAIEVRRFDFMFFYFGGFSVITENVISLLFLPFSYLLELGFFFVVALIWIQQFRRKDLPENPFHLPEIILLGVVIVVCSFVRSSILESNDLGWRGWLFGQFVLLIWAMDVHQSHPSFSGYLGSILRPKEIIVNRTLTLLLLFGFLTSVTDVTLLRFWNLLVDKGVAGFPNGLSPDTQLGQRTFSARLAYDYINHGLPANVVIQYNPLIGIDRASGLYGNRQNAISANTAYNIPPSTLDANTREISKIFMLEQVSTWMEIDLLCHENYIDVLAVKDLDPLWKSLPILYEQRAPLYKNQYFAILACGDFVPAR